MCFFILNTLLQIESVFNNMVCISLSVRARAEIEMKKKCRGRLQTNKQPTNQHELWWFWLFTCSSENYVQSILCISSSKLFTSESHVISHFCCSTTTATIIREPFCSVFLKICQGNWNTVERIWRSSLPCVSHEQKRFHNAWRQRYAAKD